jgi:hypothetical protein
VNLDVAGNYPVEDHATITVKVDPPEAFSIWLRIPAWSLQTQLKVNGELVAVKPGTYAKVHRTWSTGDRIAITFDMRGRVVQAPDGNEQIAICRGPIVLSLDNRLVPSASGLATLTTDGSGQIELTPNPAAATRINAWMAFDVGCTVDGKPSTLTFCDYADAGNEFSRQNMFRTWLPQPLDLKTVYDTRQTWRTLSHANHWTDAPQQ